jgi:hypothetical protein
LPRGRKPIRRALRPRAAESGGVLHPLSFAMARRVCNTIIDVGSLGLPNPVAEALAEAFWSHIGVQSDRNILTRWSHLRVFARFAHESKAVSSVKSIDRIVLARYVEWLNAQRRENGDPWTKSSRASAFGLLRKLLQWLERCRPELIDSIEYPVNPFPWRNRDTPFREKLSALDLRHLLSACESDIRKARESRRVVPLAKCDKRHPVGSLIWLLSQINSKFDGIVPPATELARAGNYPIRQALLKHGGSKLVESYLYPKGPALVPYYLALLVHSAGNPDPIVALRRDCLHSVPLLDNREALVWFKARAQSVQRRTFDSHHEFQPPSLVREILAWSERLLPYAPGGFADRLLLYVGRGHVTAMTTSAIKQMLPDFCKRHGLPRFALASIRPSVLASFYRAGGNLRTVSKIANHANLSTTVRYVMGPDVHEQNRARIAILQNAFVGKMRTSQRVDSAKGHATPALSKALPSGPLVSLFGFDCENPYEGVAPGTQRGKLCTNFMGCFNCPNAVITADPLSVARLLQAQVHLRESAMTLHPARWEAFYASQLRILDEDIIPRFSAAELARARPLVSTLSPLPELR